MTTTYEPPNTFYSQTYGLFENEDMYKFIGKNGAHFKFLTTKLGLDYIWWNKDTNVIELWGPHYKLKNAKKMIIFKLDEFMEKNKKTLKRAKAMSSEDLSLIKSYVNTI